MVIFRRRQSSGTWPKSNGILKAAMMVVAFRGPSIAKCKTKFAAD
jgi:hypothetical protein